jgi:prepilin-type N-terminal cleavage/methylation domain-containing protein
MKSTKPGLSLIEVVIAVLILGIATTSLVGLQGVLVRGVFSAHALIDRLGFIRSFFVEVDKDRLFVTSTPPQKVIEDPRLVMNYTQKRPLSKTLITQMYLAIEHVEAQWPTPFGMRKDSFARISFRPQKEKKA